MPRLSKKIIKEIQIASVFDSILRERFTSSMTGYFADDRPEMWNGDQKEIFDIAAEVEHQTKTAILRILGIKESNDTSN